MITAEKASKMRVNFFFLGGGREFNGANFAFSVMQNDIPIRGSLKKYPIGESPKKKIVRENFHPSPQMIKDRPLIAGDRCDSSREPEVW